MKLTQEQIYKRYKHGESLAAVDTPTLKKALKAHGLQIVQVTDDRGCVRLWNYIPEINKMELVR